MGEIITVDQMGEIVPRYEFRAFAQTFGRVAERIRALSPCENIRESTDIYIISAGTDKHNTKIRYNQMDIKDFVKDVKGLEQWTPRVKAEFPITAADLREYIFPAWNVDMPKLTRDAYTQAQYLDEIIRPHPALLTARVYKLRFSFTIHECITEIAHLEINGAAIRTVAVESEDIDAVLAAQETLGLDAYHNVNYLVAIKRIMGLAPLPG